MIKPPSPEIWRTTTFRLASMYGAVFAVGVLGLLGLVYWRTTSALTLRVDSIVRERVSGLTKSSPAALPAEIRRQLAADPEQLDAIGLISPNGETVAGNVDGLPARLRPGGPIRETAATNGLRKPVRAQAVRLPWGEVLIVGRDISQIRQLRAIILSALLGSGALIVVLGLASGIALSLAPLRRLQALQGASHRIIDGDLEARMPMEGRGDELDLFAAMVNGVLDEVRRLLEDAKSANDAVAHNLRTPLTRVRNVLHRAMMAAETAEPTRRLLRSAIEDLDLTLERFRALLRISQIEAQERRRGFQLVNLEALLRDAGELYEPLAEANGLVLNVSLDPGPPIQADAKLLFEAISNLLDNAIKFCAAPGVVELGLTWAAGEARLWVSDRGPGIPPDERAAVLQRFYRGVPSEIAPGSGLGLSIVAAIARLHGFELRLEDALPGLRVTLARDLNGGPSETR